MASGNPARPARQRAVAAIVLVAAILLPWIAASLIAREILPGDERRADTVFAVALGVTYIGGWALALLLARSGRAVTIRAIATTFVLVVIVGILELPAALRLVHWTILFRNLSGEGVDYATAFVRDPDLSFRRIPDLQWSGRPASDVERRYGLTPSLERPITFTFDQWGYRNAVEMERADVVLVGDSFVEGWYVSDEQTVAAQLATRLGRPVANLGVAGYGPLQELRVLQGDALRRQPRVIVWFFYEGNDLYDDQYFENALLGEAPSEEETRPHVGGMTRYHGWKERSFVLNAFRSLRRLSNPLMPRHPRYWATLAPAEGAREVTYLNSEGSIRWKGYEADRWETARGGFELGIDAVHDRGVAIMLVYIPNKYRVYRDLLTEPMSPGIDDWGIWTELSERFRELCASRGIPCLDLTDSLAAAAARGIPVYARTDTHWSAEGHALVAELLEPHVRRLLESAP